MVPGLPLPEEVFHVTRPLVVGLTNDPDRLIQVRTQRLASLHQQQVRSEYTDLDKVKEEVTAARRLFTERNWPVIDVSRRSIEETAAAILRLLARARGEEV
jgi:[pyruvate, water dikinase]-phosphate phosphotransferase / [pyruvate, water dikinase] kinase